MARGGEDVLLVFALPDVASHIAERVVVIARVAHGQQVTVFGIEDEKEAVEENQNGLAHVRQGGLWRGGGDGAGQSGKDLIEDQLGQIRGDAFFVEPRVFDGPLVKRARIGRPRDERRPPEDEREHGEPVTTLVGREGKQPFVVAGEVEKRREVELEELLRDGPGSLIIEPPPGRRW